MRYFQTSPCSFIRWLEGIIVVFSGLACFLSFYLIRFDLCENADCGRLQITKFWVDLSELYLVYGFSVLVVGVMLISNKQLNRCYRFGLELSVLTGVVLSCMLVFAISNEIANLGSG